MLKRTGYLKYDVKGKQHTKKVKLPKERYGYGIYKQRSGYVKLAGFKKNPKKHGYGRPNFITKTVKIPKSAGLSRLKIGKRIISKAK
jgi:hypothetical protein